MYVLFMARTNLPVITLCIFIPSRHIPPAVFSVPGFLWRILAKRFQKKIWYVPKKFYEVCLKDKITQKSPTNGD